MQVVQHNSHSITTNTAASVYGYMDTVFCNYHQVNRFYRMSLMHLSLTDSLILSLRVSGIGSMNGRQLTLVFASSGFLSEQQPGQWLQDLQFYSLQDCGKEHSRISASSGTRAHMVGKLFLAWEK